MTPHRWFLLTCAAGFVVLIGGLFGARHAEDIGVALQRSEEIVAGKIARKEAKLRGGQYPDDRAGPDGRSAWRAKMRAGLSGSEIRRRQKQALKHLAAMPAPGGLNQDAAIDGWTWIGPGNIGGRARSIDIDPNDPQIIHLATAGGGIWRTQDAGASWAPVNDFLPNLAVVTLARASATTLYAGTGEGFNNADALPGDGIYRSLDNGSSWTQLASTDGEDFQWVNRMAVNPVNANVLLAATRTGLWRSEDAGASWTEALAGWFVDVKFHPNEDEAIAAMRHEWFADGSFVNGEVHTSLDGGATWTEETTGDPGKLPTTVRRCEVLVTEEYLTGGETDWWYASCDNDDTSSDIHRASGEGTLSWSLRMDGTGNNDYLDRQGWYDNTIWVSPHDVDDLVVGGIDLYRSTDGGTTLTRISNWRDYHDSNPGFSPHADHHFILAHPGFDGTSNRRLYIANDGGIQTTGDFLTVSQNAGWANLANNLGITQFYDGDASPDMRVALGAAQDNSVLRYRSASGAQGWFQQFTGDGTGVAVDFDNPNILYSTTQFLNPRRSTDGGATWSSLSQGIPQPGNGNFHPFVPVFEMDPNDATTLYAGSQDLWRITVGSTDWTSQRAPQAGSPDITGIDIAEGNANVVWIGYDDGQVARSTDGAASWTRVDDNSENGSPTLPDDRPVTDLKIDPINTDRVYVSFGGYEANSLWMTEDNGATWQLASGDGNTALPAIQINTIELHPAAAQWVYVGTDLGVLASEDRGQTWSRTPYHPGTPNGNEGPVNTEVADLFWAGDRLLAATHGRGMYWTRPLAFIYVDDTNATTGDGTLADPYRDFANAYDRAGNGSTIFIFSGTYAPPAQAMTKRITVLRYPGGLGSAVIE
ncbi:MAG: hypothetical protein AAGI08_02200 [Bacteroidota bacterium]